MQPSPLATVEDVSARLGRPFTNQEAGRAGALLDDASALVRAHTRQTFAAPPVAETMTLRAQGGELRLPARPVQAVEQVHAVIGLTGVADVPVVGWAWDGADLVHVPESSIVINLPEDALDAPWRPRSYRVRFRHGYDAVPADVVAVVCAVVLRALTAPSMTGGVVSETIGAYSYRLADGMPGGTAVTLTGADRQALAPSRRTSGVIMLRM